MLSIGIDQSLSSTGISITEDGKLIKAYLVTNRPPKKKFERVYDDLDIVTAGKFELQQYTYYPDDGDEYLKTSNVICCAEWITRIVTDYFRLNQSSDGSYAFFDGATVTLEGIAFSSRNTSRLDELSALNYLIRERLLSHNIPFRVITPTANKKVFTGNGCATKELMTESFLKLNPEFEELKGLVKLDDIADSFALATYK